MNQLPSIPDVTRNDISNELCRITTALQSSDMPSDRFEKLYSAQQALAWVDNPNIAAPPSDVILGGRVQPLMGTQAS